MLQLYMNMLSDTTICWTRPFDGHEHVVGYEHSVEYEHVVTKPAVSNTSLQSQATAVSRLTRVMAKVLMPKII